MSHRKSRNASHSSTHTPVDDRLGRTGGTDPADGTPEHSTPIDSANPTASAELTDPTDPYERYADYVDDDTDDDLRAGRSQHSRRKSARRPRLVAEGRSGRSEVDRDEGDPDTRSPADPDWFDPDRTGDGIGAVAGVGVGDESRREVEPSPLSSYDVAQRGPDPVPDWLITDLNARDTWLGVLKTGKEADVSLLDRSLPGGPGCLLAVKTYRDTQHRMFHRDAGYLEGRRTRRSREGRAMAKRTAFGRELQSGRWAAAEFAALSQVWLAGGRVPYPVQLIGSELMMEFVGDQQGSAAPRLAAVEADSSEYTELYHDLVATLEIFAEAGLTHGDLSAYNVLVSTDPSDGESHCVVIDVPQVIDVIANPQGLSFLRRDCTNITDFFSRRGVLAADADALSEHLWALAGGSDAAPDRPVGTRPQLLGELPPPDGD